MLQIKAYKTVDSSSAEITDILVADLLKKGYQMGGPSAAFANGSHPHFVQTMVLYMTMADLEPTSPQPKEPHADL